MNDYQMNDYLMAVYRGEAMADPTPATLARQLGYPAPHHVVHWWRQARQGHRLIHIQASRRHFKSRSMVIIDTLDQLNRDPNLRIILVGESAGTVRKWLSEIKQHIERPDSVVSHMKPDKPKLWNNDAIIINRDLISGDPSIQAVGWGGTMLGSGADRIKADDVVSLENASTLARRDSLEDWFLNVLLPIRSKTSITTVVGTPWHESDLYACLMANPEWLTIRYPAMGEGEPYREGVLWPEEYPVERLEQEKRAMGSVAFAQQFLLDLSQVEGGMVNRAWIRHYPVLPGGEYEWRIGVDPSIGKTETSDYTGIVVTARVRGSPITYVHDMDVGRWEAQARIDAVQRMYEKYPDAHIVVEESAVSSDWITMLRRDTSLPVKPIGHGGRDKVSRLNTILPALERGDVVFSERLRGSMLISQLIEFPSGSHDDLVDALGYSIAAHTTGGVITMARLSARRDGLVGAMRGIPRIK